MRRQYRRYQSNRPFKTFEGTWYTIRIWRNELEGGQFELKADIYNHAEKDHTRSFPREELNDILYVGRQASDFMQTHEVRRLWKRLLSRH